MNKYADFSWEMTEQLLSIDSPSGFTDRAAEWVKKAFEILGFDAQLTRKGGVLVDLGISPERIWLEEEATSTWENITFSLDLIESATGTRPDKIGVLSSEYHLFRASLLGEKCGVDLVGIPAETSRFSQKVNHFMREIAGVWHYLILGGSYE